MTVAPAKTNPSVAIVGLGRMGARHVEAAELGGRRIHALVDPFDAPFALALRPGLRALHRRSINDIDPRAVDVLIVATTADHHAQITSQAITNGFKRILIEKPVTQSVSDAINLRDIAASHGARLIVNHGRRYCEAYRRVLALSQQKFGPVRSFFVRFGGGSMGCVGTHWIDLANLLIGGSAAEVFSTATKPVGNPRGTQFSDPGGTLTIAYDNGGAAIIDIRDDVGFVGGASISFQHGELAWHDEFKPWQLRMRSLADQAKPLSQYGLPLVVEEFAPSESSRIQIPATDTQHQYSGAQAILNYAAAALDDALSDSPPISGMTEAIETMKIYAAARESQATSVSVKLNNDYLSVFDKRFDIP
jgi:predicted dehydrogenase